MKKYILDLKVVSVEPLSDKHVLIKLTDDKALPEILPGQFVEVRVDHSPATMLRRPISINFVDREQNQLWLLVAVVGDGTRQLSKLQQGDVLNCMLPLGNGFTMPTAPGQRYLLVGGGVGVAPLLYFGKQLKDQGAEPVFLLGAVQQPTCSSWTSLPSMAECASPPRTAVLASKVLLPTIPSFSTSIST